MRTVEVSPRSLSPFVELLGAERMERVAKVGDAMRELLGSHAVWNVSSTAKGGGVAEMLHSLLRYARGLGVDVRWAVLDAPPEFFRITKRVHNALHDDRGDGSPLGPEQAAIFERETKQNFATLDDWVRPGDVVICHDPQTAGLVPLLVRRGVRVVWRCHIGFEVVGAETEKGWAFLRPYLEDVPVAVFSRPAYAPVWLPRKRLAVIPPNIDPFSVKNQWMPEDQVHAILSQAGIVHKSSVGAPIFVRNDGTEGRVTRTAEVVRMGERPEYNVPIVMQVGRWDRMKDPIGVLRAFALLCERGDSCGAELVLAGPMVRSIPDDPEAPDAFRDVERAWLDLPDRIRSLVHLAQLPMDDPDENAAIVNALQRHAAIVTQKSLREGFGLTVTEAMWKSRPIVASALEGIIDQIRDGVDGLLVHNPTDIDEAARAFARLLGDPAFARRLGQSAHEHAKQDFVSVAALERWAELVRMLMGAH